MKVSRKFVGSIPLKEVPDSPDGNRVAVTNTAQAFVGGKKLNGAVMVKRDPTQRKKNLICEADVDDLLNKLPGAAIESVELTQEHVSGKGFSLSWSNYPHIQAKLQIGDKMLVRYIAKGGA